MGYRNCSCVLEMIAWKRTARVNLQTHFVALELHRAWSDECNFHNVLLDFFFSFWVFEPNVGIVCVCVVSN